TSLNTSVFADPEGGGKRGLHGELIQGFPDVDPLPDCYSESHNLGFGSFVRWVYFANPSGLPEVLGVDWRLDARRTAGMSLTMRRVSKLATTLAAHGIPGSTELALLNPRMCEDPCVHAVRSSLELVTIADWCEKGNRILGPQSCHCPRCGQMTLGQKT